MKYILLFPILLLSISQSLLACSAAYQYSLFPLGSSMGQLLIIELEMNRYLTSPQQQMMQFGNPKSNSINNIEVRWKGTIRLMRMEGDSMILEKDLGFSDVLDEAYQSSLQPIFEEALHYAETLPMFEAAQLKSLGCCHYNRSCNYIQLDIDTSTTQFLARSNEEGYQHLSKQITFSPSTLQKVENTTKIKFTDFENIEKGYQLDFFRLWSPQTVRRFEIGTQTILIYTIGRGDKSRYTQPTAKDWQFPNLQDISYHVQGNDVLFHGQRFDILHIL